jgi:hypothetical protein
MTNSESQKHTKSVSFSHLIEQLKTNKAIFIVDACHSEAMFSSTKNFMDTNWQEDKDT